MTATVGESMSQWPQKRSSSAERLAQRCAEAQANEDGRKKTSAWRGQTKRERGEKSTFDALTRSRLLEEENVGATFRSGCSGNASSLHGAASIVPCATCSVSAVFFCWRCFAVCSCGCTKALSLAPDVKVRYSDPGKERRRALVRRRRERSTGGCFGASGPQPLGPRASGEKLSFERRFPY